MTRDWYWPIEAAGQGPDWFFSASFADGNAARLAALVQQYPLPDFVRHRVNQGLCAIHRRLCTYDEYVDQRNAARLAQSAGEQQNSWIYHSISVCGHDFMIERGYGGYPGGYGATETGLIVLLAQAPDLSMAEWQIGYGGAGYPAGWVATGTTAAELLAALAGD